MDDYSYLLTYVQDNKDESIWIDLLTSGGNKKKKKPSCKDREAVAHGIDLLIVNDFIFTHESKSSDEQLRKKNRRENK